MEWTSAVKEGDPWNEIRVNFRDSMDFKPKGESALSRYEADWGRGLKLGKVYRRSDCAPRATLDFAVRDWADNFKAGGSQTTPLDRDDLGGAMMVNTAPDVAAEAPPAPPPAPARVVASVSARLEAASARAVARYAAKSPVPSPASPVLRSPDAAPGRPTLAGDPGTAASVDLVRCGLTHAATPPPRGRSMLSAARSGFRRFGAGLDAALTAAMPVADAFKAHVDEELAAGVASAKRKAEERRAAIEERAVRAAAQARAAAAAARSAAKRAHSERPPPRTPPPPPNIPAPAYENIQAMVADLPDGLQWQSFRTALGGTGISHKDAWAYYKSLNKHV